MSAIRVTVTSAAVTLRDHADRLTDEVNHRRWGPGGALPSRVSAWPWRCPMTTTTSTSTALAVPEPVFTKAASPGHRQPSLLGLVIPW